MKLLEVQIDFFVPLWRRVILVAFCLLWSLVEFNNGMVFWGSVFVAIGAYSLWQFFFDGWPAKHVMSNQVGNEKIGSDQVMNSFATENSSVEESSANSDSDDHTSSAQGTDGMPDSSTASSSSNEVTSDNEKNHV